jgi:hypothetical protein
MQARNMYVLHGLWRCVAIVLVRRRANEFLLCIQRNERTISVSVSLLQRGNAACVYIDGGIASLDNKFSYHSVTPIIASMTSCMVLHALHIAIKL